MSLSEVARWRAATSCQAFAKGVRNANSDVERWSRLASPNEGRPETNDAHFSYWKLWQRRSVVRQSPQASLCDGRIPRRSRPSGKPLGLVPGHGFCRKLAALARFTPPCPYQSDGVLPFVVRCARSHSISEVTNRKPCVHARLVDLSG